MKRWIYSLVPLFVLLGLIAWKLDSKKHQAAADDAQRQARMHAAPMVSVAQAHTQDIVQTFQAVGNVEAPMNVKIAPRVTGRILYLGPQEGDHVTQGELLARIDPGDVYGQLNQAKANLAEAQFRLSQAKITQNPTNVSVTTAIDQQAAGLASADADFNQARQSYVAQRAAAQEAVTDAQSKVNAAQAGIENAQAAIRSAQANLENSQAKFDRTNGLYKQGFVAAQDVDDARTAVSVQQAALDVARGQLNSAKEAKASAVAQLNSARQNLQIVTVKGAADVEAARAKRNQARASLTYAKANTAQRPAYQQNIAALQAGVAAAQAAVHSAEIHMRDCTITSPLDGYVTSRVVDPGAMAQPGTLLYTIQSIRQVWVTIPVPEEVSRKFYLGMTGKVALDALPGQSFVGKVIQVNPSADPLSRQFNVRVALDNPRNLIKPGMFARATFVTERVPSTLVVANEAIQTGPAGSYVLALDHDNVVHRRPVTLGAASAAVTAVTSGLQPGDTVITLSANPLRDGQKVRPAPVAAGEADGRKSS